MAIAKKSSRKKRGEMSSQIDQLYSAEFIGALAREFEIRDKNEINLMKTFLIKGAALYGATARMPTVNQELAWHRETFEQLLHVTVDLESRLNALSDEQRFRLWDLVWDAPWALGRIFSNASVLGFDKPPKYEPESSLRDLLSNLRKRLGEKLVQLPQTDEGGRPRNQALFVWAVVMHEFWEDVLNRKFSRGDKRGNAYSFCVRAIARLDPNVSAAELRTAMRRAVEPLPVKMSY